MMGISQIRFDNHIGEKLVGTLHEPPHPAGKGMVLGHCFTCSRHTRILSDLGQAMADIGYWVLRFDFSGNGQSEGDFKESIYSKQVREMQCAMDYIRDRGCTSIMLAGHSMGGTVALLTASKMTDVDGVIAFSVSETLLYPDRLLTENQKADLDLKGETSFSSRGRNLIITDNFFKDANQYDLTQTTSKLRCPALLIYGGQDELIAPDSGRILYDANPAETEVFVIDGADHMFSQEKDRQTAVRHVIQWVETQM